MWLYITCKFLLGPRQYSQSWISPICGITAVWLWTLPQSVFIELVLSGLGQHWALLGCAFGLDRNGGAGILNLLSSSCFAKASLLLPDLLGCGGPRRRTLTLGVIRNRLRAGGKATASMLWRQHIGVRYSPSSCPDSYLINMCTHCDTACSHIGPGSFDIHSLIMPQTFNPYSCVSALLWLWPSSWWYNSLYF